MAHCWGGKPIPKLQRQQPGAMLGLHRSSFGAARAYHPPSPKKHLMTCFLRLLTLIQLESILFQTYLDLNTNYKYKKIYLQLITFLSRTGQNNTSRTQIKNLDFSIFIDRFAEELMIGSWVNEPKAMETYIALRIEFLAKIPHVYKKSRPKP